MVGCPAENPRRGRLVRRALEDSILHGPKRERPNGPVRWPSEPAEEGLRLGSAVLVERADAR